MYRQSLTLAFVVAVVTIVGCSGTENLSPAPSKQTGGHSGDTAIVTGGATPQSPPPVVSSFALSGLITGHDAGPDTTKVSPVPNATVTLVEVAGVNGDTLSPSVAVTSTTTDGNGKFRLENLAPAYYRIDIGAPEGSPYADATWGVGPARSTEVSIDVALRRKP